MIIKEERNDKRYFKKLGYYEGTYYVIHYYNADRDIKSFETLSDAETFYNRLNIE